jgi:hypothetical protein
MDASNMLDVRSGAEAQLLFAFTDFHDKGSEWGPFQLFRLITAGSMLTTKTVPSNRAP